ncbi:MAG: TerB family tellurite resistance protein [Pseudanabaenaceae cyanobacterium SKYGB_i_bin29]|nr:TerB family tellurite resistance protein [Pseudanabaenaceae cyanobacterium SKYG29]MDW8422420.1 TerB family tellurite resistance protein [Pseudanabaenaceae cyanobacterium SKYGB_i_bin29]
MTSVPPPSITPRQMNLLRVVASMAWADGQLEPQELTLLLEKLSELFAVTPAHREQLVGELQDYIQQRIPLEESIPKLETQTDRELVLKLGYEVIYCSRRTPDEPRINMEEAAAYQKLLKLLNLPADTVEKLEAEAIKAVEEGTVVSEIVAKTVAEYLQRQ